MIASYLLEVVVVTYQEINEWPISPKTKRWIEIMPLWLVIATPPVESCPKQVVKLGSIGRKENQCVWFARPSWEINTHLWKVIVTMEYLRYTYSSFLILSDRDLQFFFQVVRYWSEKGKEGYKVWRYELVRDDKTPAPWTKKGVQLIREKGLDKIIEVDDGINDVSILAIACQNHWPCSTS